MPPGIASPIQRTQGIIIKEDVRRYETEIATGHYQGLSQAEQCARTICSTPRRKDQRRRAWAIRGTSRKFIIVM